MGHQKITQATLTSQASINQHQTVESFALFHPNGTPLVFAGSGIALTGYAIGTVGAVAATDTINAAIGKLEARIEVLEDAS